MSGEVSFLDAANAAKRMADKNGVTIDVVFAKFRQGVRKSALSYTDFFWGKGDISLGKKKVIPAGSRSRSAGRLGSRAMVGAARKTARVKA